jgi:NAD(P)-dependent dehydrogenase (short-subunit alcohol dehydrogenase family)
MSRPGRLAGKTALIVGGTGGIGLACARRFLQEGASVVITGLPSESGDALMGELVKLGPAWWVAMDVRDAESVASGFSTSVKLLGGRLDILFHVAGVSGRAQGDGPLDACSEDGWDWVMDTNARGTFLTNRAAVRQMMSQPRDHASLRGTVLNMGSVLSQSPSPRYFGTYAYAASKGAIQAMTLSAAARYAADGIRFNVLAPGLIDTPMAQRAVQNPTIRAYLESKQPLARGPGTPDDCVDAALYLCEPASRLVTGTVLAVDGGWHVAEGQMEHEEHS